MRAVNQLTTSKVKKLSAKGRYADGAGLYLYVSESGSKSWVYRWKVNGRRREMGLGGFPKVSLARARERAFEAKEHILDGIDPIAEKKKQTEPIFSECVDQFLGSMENQWRNEKHRKQWRMTLDVYCKPIAGKRVSEIDTHDVLTVLQPIWQTKQETASRLRGRIERVLDYAAIHGWREGVNPAMWRGHLKSVLPPRQKLARGHHSAISYRDLPILMGQLTEIETPSSSALQFLILTAARTSEVIRATWDEIDHEKGVWTVPAIRMKAGRDHRVPLSEQALSRLAISEGSSGHLFPGKQQGRPLSNMAMAQVLRRLGRQDITVHGMRSAFRDWVGEETNFPREIAEAALAHRIGDAAEQAYRRQDALEKRRVMMEAWSQYLSDDISDKVVALANQSNFKP